MREFIDLVQALNETLDLTEGREIPETPYGYWITPEGEYIVVGREQHIGVLKERGIHTGLAYEGGWDKGWIRIVARYTGRQIGNVELSVEFFAPHLTVRSIGAVKRLAAEAKFDYFVGQDIVVADRGFDRYRDGEFKEFESGQQLIAWMTQLRTQSKVDKPVS